MIFCVQVKNLEKFRKMNNGAFFTEKVSHLLLLQVVDIIHLFIFCIKAVFVCKFGFLFSPALKSQERIK